MYSFIFLMNQPIFREAHFNDSRTNRFGFHVNCGDLNRCLSRAILSVSQTCQWIRAGCGVWGGPILIFFFGRNVGLDRWVRMKDPFRRDIWRWEQMNMFLLFFLCVCVMLVVHSICLVEVRQRWFWLVFERTSSRVMHMCSSNYRNLTRPHPKR